jgi:membrane protein involved in colicin uptake
MSDTIPTPADIAPVEPAQATPEPAVEPDWKAEARKWESRAKENKGAAERLAEIEEANKSAEQKAAERLAVAEKAAAEAEAKVLRRDIAIEHKLSAADAALLDTITDEAALRSLAARLTPSDEPAGARTPRPDPNQGKSGRVPATTGDQFAAFFTTQLGG